MEVMPSKVVQGIACTVVCDSPDEYCPFNPDNNLVGQVLLSSHFTEEEMKA